MATTETVRTRWWERTGDPSLRPQRQRLDHHQAVGALPWVRMPGPPELPTTATRLPRGNGWSQSTLAASSICSIVSTLSTPAWVNRASTTTSDAAAAGVWERPACCPAGDRPALMAMIGLLAETLRAIPRRAAGGSLPH